MTVHRPEPTTLQLDYLVRGDIAKVRVPQWAPPEQRDELWRHTCAELFVAAMNEEAYYEFNFSPTSQWAAYAFSGYRQGMHSLPSATPAITCQQTTDELLLRVTVALPPALINAARRVELGLSMVIEDSSAVHSYWAVAHAAAQPDFHCRASFVLQL